ncbi:MAG: alpha/beta hydrolase [Gammaproteobacteria bacterium]|nr:alpha/beta hydrolase [Gammaproteobacteria bacterium]
MMRCLALLLCIVLLSGCSQFLFYPHPLLIRTPADVELEYRDIQFSSQDGTPLHGWMLPAATQPATATVLLMHGNAENISTHLGSVYWLPERGFNVFLFDYRGYGKSAGEPTLVGVHQDAERALEVVLAQPESDGVPLVLFGQSLGGAIAISTTANSAYRARIKGLIIESSFSSYQMIAREALAGFWLTWPLQWPLSLTISDVYHPGRAIERTKGVPVLVIHGEQDRVVAYHHGETLYRRANEPKQLWSIPAGQHIDTFNEAENRERLVDYLNALLINGEAN